jgi:hypothetical protein
VKINRQVSRDFLLAGREGRVYYHHRVRSENEPDLPTLPNLAGCCLRKFIVTFGDVPESQISY